jgi:hypothetical protein
MDGNYSNTYDIRMRRADMHRPRIVTAIERQQESVGFAIVDKAREG